MKTFTKILSVLSVLFINHISYAQEPTDCIDSVIICGNSTVNLNVNGVGVQELNNSNTCGSSEHNSIWLQVTLVTDGTLGFTLRPNSSAIQEDYDFFVFGPNVLCNNIGQAIRCSTTNPASAGLPNNLTGMNASSVDTSEGPGPHGDSFVRWLDVQAGDTYFIVIDRPIGNSGFTLEWTGTAEFSPPPVSQENALTPLDLEMCDTVIPYEDGFTSFNLEVNTPIIAGTQTNVSLSYHLTDSDANIDINPLSSPYTNISNPQDIFVRITNTITGCFEITDFSLSVNLGPEYEPPSPFSLCDSNGDGNNNNGHTFFDLNSKNSEILKGQDPSSINISYHESKISAEMGTAALSSPYYNLIPNNQQIFVRIEDALRTNCRTISTLNLVVNPLPEIFEATLVQCDLDGTIDGFTIFNLEQAKEALTAGSLNRSLRYYLNTDDAENNNNEISGSAYKNIMNPQVLSVRVTDDLTGCYSMTKLNLEISTTTVNNAQLDACDNDSSEDGLYSFNLSDVDGTVLSSLPQGLDLFYYETYEDALLENNPLLNEFTNTIPYSQTIYARVEKSNACYGISEVELRVFEMPNVELEDEAIYCLNKFPDKITITGGVINDPPNNYTYAWSTGESTSEIMVDNPGSYSVRISNPNGCFKDRTIKVLASNIATITQIDITDATQNNTVKLLLNGEGDYEYALDDINGPYQNSATFEKVLPGFHSVFVRDINGCGITVENISVIGFPKYFTPNNDGINDRWQVSGIDAQFQSKSTIYIFDRMGKLLNELHPLSNGWDGNFLGKPMPTNDYWFSVTLQDGRVFNGHFSLKR
ncbi:T9SS type B sorting domain-containing protein [Gelidibacter gilvus]|uniref:T9SS type B sorting domain-containing protein n=1 Tax=Gelidibacter gilvus TaxID=59602 RepID=A0A4Q0XGZ9_9FLAO|nr:T9SS type B sorting domain-containing protein [Gelidibacter gilvus]RXJ50628.1 T9SS type B sorting domain-containing protein [Gelidibacter gilvus]